MQTCPTCRLVFNSERDFDSHRVGSFSQGFKQTRRCLTTKEMQEKNWIVRGRAWSRVERTYNG